MFWYIFNYISIVLTDFITSYRKRSNVVTLNKDRDYRTKTVCIIATINAIILSAFRDLSVGADTGTYYYSFINIFNTDWVTTVKLYIARYVEHTYNGDPGYTFIQKVFQIFFHNFQWWLLFIACLFFISFAIYIYRNSKDYLLSWALFFTLFFGFYGTTGLRQTIAMSIVIWAIPYITKKKLIPFLILIGIASTIHASVVCIIPLYWLSRIKFNRKSIILYWVLIGLSFIFRYQLLDILRLLTKYEGYGDYVSAGAPVFTFLLIFLALIISVFYKNITKNNDVNVNMYCNATMMAGAFSALLMINPSLMRVVMYYDFFLLTLLPEFGNIFNKKSYVAFRYIVIIACLLLMIKSGGEYKFGEFVLF